jgi:hypothetical protein
VLLPLTVIEKVIGNVLGLREKTQFEEAHDELRHCSAQLKDAWQTFTDHKHELLPSDKAQCFQTLSTDQERLNEAWTRLKGARGEFYEAKRAAHEQNRREWEAKRAAHEQNRCEWEAKQQEFRARVRERIQNLEEKLEKARGALSRQEAT